MVKTYAGFNKTKFVSARFCNVYGSSGSVVQTLERNKKIYETLENELYKAIQKGEIKREDAETLRVSILTSKYINNLKSDTLIDDFIEQTKDYDIPKNIQAHMHRLLEIFDKWSRAGRYEDAALLGEYIKVLEKEFQLRSNVVRVNIGDLDPKIAELQAKAEEALQKRIEKKQRRAANAANNHGEVSYDKYGNALENRKILMHTPKFNP